MATAIVVGLDGGGTHTRALAADLDGRPLAYVETGGSNPQHHPQAEENARAAVVEVIHAAGCSPGQVAALVAGFAGLDDAEDHVWADRYTTILGLDCPRLHVNDAVVAHAGALRSQPGIIAISGTGSIVFGVTETGRALRNFDFRHYADSSARAIAHDVIVRILVGDAGERDAALVEAVFECWEVQDLPAFRELAASGFSLDRTDLVYRLGRMAPLVTAAAEEGAPIACAVCDAAAAVLARGIRLVGSCFRSSPIPVARIGGVASSRYIGGALQRALAVSPGPRYELREPALSSAQGAVLMALAQCGVVADERVCSNLQSRHVGVAR